MYEKPQVNATYTFTRDLPYTLPVIYLYARMHVKIMRQWKSTFTETAPKSTFFFLPTEALSSMVFVPA